MPRCPAGVGQTDRTALGAPVIERVTAKTMTGTTYTESGQQAGTERGGQSGEGRAGRAEAGWWEAVSDRAQSQRVTSPRHSLTSRHGVTESRRRRVTTVRCPVSGRAGSY